MAAYYVGLDVHSRKSSYAIQTAEGELLAEGSVPTTGEAFRELRDRYALPPETPVGLESGTVAFHVARELAGLGFVPAVVDAHEVRLKAYRPRQKCDRRDAREICEGLRRGIYRSLVHVPPEAILELRELLSRRRHFVRMRAAEVHALKRLLRSRGLGEWARGPLGSERAWARLLSRLAGQPLLQACAGHHHELWRCAAAQVEALGVALGAAAAPYQETLDRLQGTPGVGPVVALSALATFSDARRFPDAKHAASYVGLTASSDQSAERNVQGHITKRGSSELRAMLCEAAQQATNPRSPLNPYYASICARRGHKMAIVAVAHRLCRILWSMLCHGTSFEIERLGVERGPFEKSSVRLYRRRRTNSSAA